jgi:DUF4097 and DUF4098 domain-containing protein YvlB
MAYGASVLGSGNSGSVAVTTDSGDVRLEKIGGTTRVEGDHLRVRLNDIQGELGVFTTSSEVHVENTSGAVDVRNDYGNISIDNAAKKVKISSRGGDVRVSGLSAGVELNADGERVEVGWAEVARDEDCLVQNASGDVWLKFPARWGGTVEAEADYGRIESQIPEVIVSDDGNRASGVVRRMARPRIRVKSGGDLYLKTTVPGRAGG